MSDDESDVVDALRYNAMSGTVSTSDGSEMEITDCDLTVTNDLNTEASIRCPDREIEFSATLELDTQEVACPHCNVSNNVPEGPFLSVITDGPYPCAVCGYPLL